MKLLESIGSLLPALLPVLGGLASAAAGIKFVHEGERALVLRLGKAVKKRNGEYRVAYPGFAIIIPWIDKFERAHVRQDVISLSMQELTLSDKTIFRVGAVLRIRVMDTPQDLYNVLFETEEPEEALKDAALTAVRDVVAPLKLDELLTGRTTLDQELADTLAPVALQWGIEVLSFKLSNCKPSEETARLIQMQAATTAKLKAAEEVAGKLECHIKEVPAAWVAAVSSVPQSVTTVTDTGKAA